MDVNPKILLAVCGGIAAYKCPDLVRRLVKAGAIVRVMMTRSATEFVTPLTMQTVSRNPVVSVMFAPPLEWEPEHIALAKWADLMIVAPATANVLGKLANGIADDLVTATLMATKAPLLLAPAMNDGMYNNPAVQANLQSLRQRGMTMIGPDTGDLADGYPAVGRMSDPDCIAQAALTILRARQDLQGRKVVVTAGGLRERIDPVRYIGNDSSGKMGYAVAEAAQQRGAKVVLISGPSSLAVPPGVIIHRIEGCLELQKTVMAEMENADAILMAAAVTDFRPEKQAVSKIKRGADALTIHLLPNPDVAAEVGARKGTAKLVVFVAETEDLLPRAMEKLQRKQADLVVANDITQTGAGFGVDTNIVTLGWPDGRIVSLPLQSKRAVAEQILDEVVRLIDDTAGTGVV